LTRVVAGDLPVSHCGSPAPLRAGFCWPWGVTRDSACKVFVVNSNSRSSALSPEPARLICSPARSH